MFSSIKIFFIGIIATAVVGGGLYVMKLRSDNAILQANQIKLEEAVESQKAVLEQQKKDFKQILQANEKLNETNNVLKAEFRALDKRFNNDDLPAFTSPIIDTLKPSLIFSPILLSSKIF